MDGFRKVSSTNNPNSGVSSSENSPKNRRSTPNQEEKPSPVLVLKTQSPNSGGIISSVSQVATDLTSTNCTTHTVTVPYITSTMTSNITSPTEKKRPDDEAHSPDNKVATAPTSTNCTTHTLIAPIITSTMDTPTDNQLPAIERKPFQGIIKDLKMPEYSNRRHILQRGVFADAMMNMINKSIRNVKTEEEVTKAFKYLLSEGWHKTEASKPNVAINKIGQNLHDELNDCIANFYIGNMFANSAMGVISHYIGPKEKKLLEDINHCESISHLINIRNALENDLKSLTKQNSKPTLSSYFQAEFIFGVADIILMNMDNEIYSEKDLSGIKKELQAIIRDLHDNTSFDISDSSFPDIMKKQNQDLSYAHILFSKVRDADNITPEIIGDFEKAVKIMKDLEKDFKKEYFPKKPSDRSLKSTSDATPDADKSTQDFMSNMNGGIGIKKDQDESVKDQNDPKKPSGKSQKSYLGDIIEKTMNEPHGIASKYTKIIDSIKKEASDKASKIFNGYEIKSFEEFQIILLARRGKGAEFYEQLISDHMKKLTSLDVTESTVENDALNSVDETEGPAVNDEPNLETIIAVVTQEALLNIIVEKEANKLVNAKSSDVQKIFDQMNAHIKDRIFSKISKNEMPRSSLENTRTTTTLTSTMSPTHTSIETTSSLQGSISRKGINIGNTETRSEINFSIFNKLYTNLQAAERKELISQLKGNNSSATPVNLRNFVKSLSNFQLSIVEELYKSDPNSIFLEFRTVYEEIILDKKPKVQVQVQVQAQAQVQVQVELFTSENVANLMLKKKNDKLFNELDKDIFCRWLVDTFAAKTPKDKANLITVLLNDPKKFTVLIEKIRASSPQYNKSLDAMEFFVEYSKMSSDKETLGARTALIDKYRNKLGGMPDLIYGELPEDKLVQLNKDIAKNNNNNNNNRFANVTIQQQTKQDAISPKGEVNLKDSLDSPGKFFSAICRSVNRQENGTLTLLERELDYVLHSLGISFFFNDMSNKEEVLKRRTDINNLRAKIKSLFNVSSNPVFKQMTKELKYLLNRLPY